MCIRDSLWDKQITAETKTKIFKTVVRNIMTYSSDAWTTNKHTRTKLMTAEMDFWRRSARISRREKIRNEVIKERMNVKNSIVGFIQTKKLQWYGHTKIMAQERLPRRVMEWTPPERSKRGRPPITWIEAVSYTHLDVYKRQIQGRRRVSALNKIENYTRN